MKIKRVYLEITYNMYYTYNHYNTYYKYLNNKNLDINMKKGKSIQKTISLYDYQVKFIEDKYINLSRFVQKKIDNEIEKRNSGKEVVDTKM